MICKQTKKLIHLSKGKAESHLKNLLQKRFHYEGQVYNCVYCKGWHVGRKKKNAHRNKYA